MILFYGVLFAVQLGLLIWCSVKSTKIKWICQLVFQGLCIVLAAGLWIYYESLPVPEGALFPGLVYFSETLSSFISAIIYGVLLLIAAGIAAFRWPRD